MCLILLLVLFVTVSPSPPIEGNSMTLACNTWTPPQTLDPPPQKLEVQRQFCFYKDGLALGLGWDSLPELRIPTVWREDSGSYWCEAKMTSLKVIRSPRVQINVHSECQRGPLLGWAGEGRGTRLVFPDGCVLLLRDWVLSEM